MSTTDRYGLIIAADGTAINHERNKVDTRRPHFIVDLEADPAHMQIWNGSAGTAYTDPGTLTTQKEILFSVKHTYKFVPFSIAYFYINSYQGQTTDPAVTGYGGEFYLLSGSNGGVNDVITYEVTATEFRIIHELLSFGLGPTGYVSPAPDFNINVKFYISAADTGTTGYNGLSDV